MRWRIGLGVMAVAVTWSTIGCTDREQTPPEAIPVAPSSIGGRDFEIPYVADARPSPPNDLAWTRCSLMTGDDDGAAECATVDVPLDRTEPSDAALTIQLFVKRYRTTSNPTGQIWLLNGGPGASGADLEDHVVDVPGITFGPTFLGMAPGLEVYLLDHRGAGRSTRLGCVAEEDPSSSDGSVIALEEWPACRNTLLAEWGTAGLAGFNITQAAHDLGELIGRTRHGTEPVFVYGVSYGTLWAQRYLSLYPTQPTGVILDSMCAPGACQFALRYDQGFNDIGQQLLDCCDSDAVCASRLGPDAWQRLGALYQKLDDGHCPKLGVDRTSLRHLLGFLLMIWPVRDYIPAVITRFDRCNDADVEALTYLLDIVGESIEPDPLFSQVLNEHIILSELMESPVPSLAEVQSGEAALFLSLDVGEGLVEHYQQGWPTYSLDQYSREFADTRVPLLMLSGEFDPQTPPTVADPLRARYTAPAQTFVSVFYTAHGVLDSSALHYDDADTLVTCGEELIRQFLAAPTAPIDQSCVGEVSAPNFGGTQSGAALLFDSTSVWGSSAALTLTPADQRAFRRAYRSAWHR